MVSRRLQQTPFRRDTLTRPFFPRPGIPRGFCHKARGYAVRGVTPGMVGKCATTPKVVVPMARTGAPTGFGVIMIPGDRFGTDTSSHQRNPIPFHPCFSHPRRAPNRSKPGPGNTSHAETLRKRIRALRVLRGGEGENREWTQMGAHGGTPLRTGVAP